MDNTINMSVIRFDIPARNLAHFSFLFIIVNNPHRIFKTSGITNKNIVKINISNFSFSPIRKSIMYVNSLIIPVADITKNIAATPPIIENNIEKTLTPKTSFL